MLILLGYTLAGRWRGLLAFGAVLAALTVVSILRIGWWLPDFIDGIRAYGEYSFPVWGPSFLPPLLRVLLLGAVSAIGLWALVRMRGQRSRDRQLDLMTIAIVGCLIALPQTGSYFNVLLIPVLMVSLYRIARRRRGRLPLLLLAMLVIVSPWLYVVIGLPDVEILTTPLVVGLLYMATRLTGTT